MLRYLREAFFLRWPLGALGDIPVNAVGVATVAVVGFFHPGFWFLGAGIEAAYLLTLALNPRFQRVVEALDRERGRGDVITRLIADLPTDLGTVYERLRATVAKINAVRASQRARSEERRVGKECISLCRSRWSPYH